MKRLSSLVIPPLFAIGIVAGAAWYVHSHTAPVPVSGDGAEVVEVDPADADTGTDTSDEPRSWRTVVADVFRRAPAGRDASVRPASRPVDPVRAFDGWTVRYLGSTDPIARRTLETEGLALAEARRHEMAALIGSDPAAALRAALPDAVRRGLPGRVQERLEQRVSAPGDFLALAAFPGAGDGAGFCAVRREAVVADRTYQAFVHGGWSSMPTREGVHIEGVAVDDRIALVDAPVRPVPAVPADEVHVAAAEGESASSATGEGASVATPRNAYTTGAKRVLFIRLRFADQAADYEPQSEESVRQSIAEASAFLSANSFGLVALEPVITPVYTLPQTAAWYQANDTSGYARNMLDAGRAIAAAPDAVAANAGLAAFAFRDHDLEVVRYSGGPGGFTGQSFVGSRGCWMKVDASGVLAHELSHNLGLWHANAWAPHDAQTVIGPGRNVEYGDVFDTMATSGGGGVHYNAYEKDRLDWLPPGAVVDEHGCGVHHVAAHDVGVEGTSGTAYALRVPRGDGRDYWFEFRQNSHWSDNAWVMNGLAVRWGAWSGSNGGSQLLDTTPFSAAGRLDAPVVIGRTYSDPVAQVHVTPLRRVDGQPAGLEVDVQRGPFPANRAPQVDLTASALEVGPGQPVIFTATATDADGDPLAWSWDFGDSQPGDNAATVTKTWTTEGDRRVRVTVSDRRGGTTSASVVVRVGRAVGSRNGGTVRDLDGRLLPEVRVHNGATPDDPEYREAWTDADGAYVLTGVPAGAWALQASLPGWTFARINTANPVVVPGDAAHADFAGYHGGFRVTGRVLFADGGPAHGAIVSDGVRSEPVESDGTFSFPGMAAGAHVFGASLPGTSFLPVSVFVSYGDAEAPAIREATYTLTGEVHGLAPGAVATVTDGHRVTTTVAVGEGAESRHAFTLTGVPAGAWHLRVALPGESFSPRSFINPLQVAGDRMGLMLVRDPTRSLSISGAVTDRGMGLAGAVVSAGGMAAVSDSRGGYFLPGLASGVHTVRVAADGRAFSPASHDVALSVADAVAVDFAAVHPLQPPVFMQPATVLSPLDQPFITLGARAEDDDGAQNLRYHWSIVGGAPGPVGLSPNHSNAARTTVAQFAAAGTYRLRVTATDPFGASAASEVDVVVAARAARVELDPVPSMLTVGEGRGFTARCFDQFGQPMPADGAVAWRVSGGGTIDASGWFSATTAGEGFVVFAEAGLAVSQGTFDVVRALAPPEIVHAARAAHPLVGASLGTTLTVVARSAAGPASLTYTWSAVGTAPGPVVFLPNGSNASAEATARFSRSGEYNLRVTVRDDDGQSAESLVQVVVQETIASWRNRFFPPGQLDNPALEKAVWGADADPDGDGVVNLLEYAFGLDPLIPGVEGLPVQSMVVVDGTEYLAVTFRPNPIATDLVYVPQVSSDLEKWETDLVRVGEDADGGLTYRDRKPAALQSKRFVRVTVTSP